MRNCIWISRCKHAAALSFEKRWRKLDGFRLKTREKEALTLRTPWTSEDLMMVAMGLPQNPCARSCAQLAGFVSVFLLCVCVVCLRIRLKSRQADSRSCAAVRLPISLGVNEEHTEPTGNENVYKMFPHDRARGGGMTSVSTIGECNPPSRGSLARAHREAWSFQEHLCMLIMHSDGVFSLPRAERGLWRTVF